MQKIPAFKYLLFLSGGIVAGLFISLDDFSSLIILCCGLLLLFLIFKFTKLSLLYPFIVILTGLVLAQSIQREYINEPVQIVPQFKAYVKGRIVKILSTKEKYSRFILAGDFVPNISDGIYDTKILLTIYGKGQARLHLREGMLIQANVNVATPQKATLPTDFDETTYARSLGFSFYCDAHYKQIGIIKYASGIDAEFNALRSDIKNRISVLFEGTNADIVTALLTGDKAFSNKDIKRDFAQTGTAHVLAISGLHIGIIASIIIVLLGFIPNRSVRFLIFSFLVFAFVILTGTQASALRAALMAVLIYLAWLAQRKINLLNILSLAVIIVILFNPQILLTIGFQMSVAALLGISVLFFPVRAFFNRLFPYNNTMLNFIKTSFALTFSSSIVIAPIVAYYFHHYSIVSPIANLLVVPLITFVLLFSILAIVSSYVSITLALFFVADTNLLLDLIQKINSLLMRIGALSLEPSMVIVLAILISLSLIYIFSSMTIRQVLFRFSVASLIILLSFQIPNDKNKNVINVYPRSALVAIHFNNSDRNIFLLIERKEQKRVRLDYGLLKFITKNSGEQTVAYTGKTGKKICKKLRSNKHIKLLYVSLEESMFMLNKIGITHSIIQKIIY